MRRVKKWVKDHPGETMIIAGVVLFGVAIRNGRKNTVVKGEDAKDILDVMHAFLREGWDVLDVKDVRLMAIPMGTEHQVLMRG